MSKETILSDNTTLSHYSFLKLIKQYKHIRVGVRTNSFLPYVYFRAQKKEVINVVRSNQFSVTFSIMFNSKVKPEQDDVMYITKMKYTKSKQK